MKFAFVHMQRQKNSAGHHHRENCVQLLARVHHCASHSFHSVCYEQNAGSTNSTGLAQGHETDAALSKFRRNSHLWRSLCLKPKSSAVGASRVLLITYRME